MSHICIYVAVAFIVAFIVLIANAVTNERNDMHSAIEATLVSLVSGVIWPITICFGIWFILFVIVRRLSAKAMKGGQVR